MTSINPTIPKGAFIGPVGLEDTIDLETALQNPFLVDPEALFGAWGHLSAVSVESALVGRPDLISFANHCLLFAAVRTSVKVKLPAFTDVTHFALPTHAALRSMGSRIVPSDPSAVYEFVNAYYGKIYPAPRRPSALRPPSGPTRANGEDSEDDEDAVQAVYEWKTIGIVYVTMSAIPHEVHIGIGLLPAFRGKGEGVKACAFAVQWAIEIIGAHRVQARIFTSPNDSRAQRLFTALGFAHEGVQRHAVPDATGAWADVTHMGIVDTEWIVRRPVPKNMWEALFEWHQREREELLRWEGCQGRAGLMRTTSMETVRSYKPHPAPVVPEALSDSEDSQCRSPSPAPSTASTTYLSSLLQELEESEFAAEYPWGYRGSVVPSEDSDVDNSDSDSVEWVLGGGHSDVSWCSSGEAISRPLSAASWSSFQSVGSVVPSSASSTSDLAA